MSTILADLTSGDTRRIHAATWAVIKLRDPVELDRLAAAVPEIERATANMDLGGIIYSNRRSLEFALRKLAYHRDRVGCLCRLYPEILGYDPEKEAEAGNVRIRDTGRCECVVCGTVFEVEYGEAHASWWEWSEARPRS